MTPKGRSWIRLDEFRLVVLAVVLALVGVATINLAPDRRTSFALPDVQRGILVGGLAVAVSLGWTILRHDGDEVLFPIVAMLSTIGYVLLLRLTPDMTALDRGY